MRNIRQQIRSFWHQKEGIAAVEFSLIVPILVLLIFGCFSLFVILDEANRAENATFTVADIVSRQTTVSPAFLETTYGMFAQMLPSTHGSLRFRVSSLKMTDKKMAVDWSYAVAPMPALTSDAIPIGKLPLISNGDSLIFVETGVGYKPVTIIGGFSESSYLNTAANRPRFTSAVIKTN